MQGILVVDKPEGFTSFDVVAKLRGICGTRRIGHGGTLDPMATGVLPVFVGGAAKAVDMQERADKMYTATMLLGRRTDTGDVTGETLEQAAVPADIGLDAVAAVLPRFTGTQQQVPPMYSAVKIGGKKLYELARKGREVERKPRPVTIHALELLERTGAGDYLLRVRCSKGTYVRTLCHDVGAALGCGGTLSALRRTEAAGFGLDRAGRLEDVQAAADRGEAERLLLPVDAYFRDHPALTVGLREERAARNGAAFPWRGADGTYRVYGPAGDFLLLGELERGRMRTVKSFYEV